MLLTGRDLVVGYRLESGRREVGRGLDFELRRGRLVALLGPNGAGKSTLLKTLAGLLPPLGGEILLGAANLASLPLEERARQLAVVFTERAAAPHLSARELVALGRHPHTDWLGRKSAADQQAIAAALTAVGATSLAERKVDELSDGELQRVAIARALAQEATILLLDEATAFLDLPRRVETFELLRRLAHDEGKAVLMSTHDLDLALRSADELWLLAPPGELLCGAPEELVLEGKFGHVFASPDVQFDIDEGAFRFTTSRRGQIGLELGNAPRRQVIWLRRALERLGWQALEGGSGSNDDIAIAIAVEESCTDFVYVLQRNGVRQRFARLGALIEELEQP